jgi:hypothetical protein
MEDTFTETRTHERADPDVETPIDTARLAARVFVCTIVLVVLVIAASFVLPLLLPG